MDVRRDLKYAYSWNFYAMKFMGIWPDERKWNRPSSYIVLLPCLMLLCFVSVPQMIDLQLIADDFNLVIENLSMANITFLISILKIINFWIHGKPLKSLLKLMVDDWSAVIDDTELKIMQMIATSIKKMIIRSTILSQIVVINYLILRYFTQKYTQSKLLFRAYFPYNDDISPNYELTVLGQYVATAYSCTSYAAVDTFVAMLVLHVCAQLMILKNQLKEFQTGDKQDLEMKLKKIVQKHVYLNRFVETLENCFNGMLLIQMLGCTVQLCFQCFQAIMSFKYTIVAMEYLYLQIIFLIGYVVYVMLQLFLYCYVGEKLSVESTELANAAYDSEWYNVSPRNARLLIIIICRARSPLTITAGRFCSFTLILYSQVLKTSLQYISVLYAMKID